MTHPPLDIQAILTEHLRASITAKEALLRDAAMQQRFVAATQAVVESYQKGGRLYIAGNGGSAADAQHLAAEFVVRLGKDRRALPAEALTVDSSILTAIGNDYGFDFLFARQLEARLQPADMFLAITTSGNSPNILKALEVCKARGNPTVLFSGHAGGKAATLADHVILAPGDHTGTIQEVHILLAHSLCAAVETALCFG